MSLEYAGFFRKESELLNAPGLTLTRKFTEIHGSGIFKFNARCLTATLQPGRLQIGKKRKTRTKSKTPGALIYNVPGSRSGGIRTRGLLVPNQTRYQTALHLDTGADEGTRTPDLLITNRLLYQLSHIGTTSKRYYNKGKMVCPALFLRAGSTSDQWTDKPLYAKLLRNRNLPDPAGSTAEGTNHEL